LAEAITLDKGGFIYVAGRTQALDFPLANPAQRKYGGGENDAFVAKLSADGQTVVYATFLGGGDADWAEDIAVDDAGNAYVAGTTYSKNFPTTSTALQRKYGGGDRDGFIVKLSPAGALIYATYLGGNRTDRLMAIAIDTKGNVCVTGSTNSNQFVPQRVERASTSARNWDVMVAKLDPSGSALVYSLRIGGTAGKEPRPGQIGGESGTAIALDSEGRAYVVGFTDSADFPFLRGTGAAPGDANAFVMMLSENGLCP
jgi:hypothetical protein